MQQLNDLTSMVRGEVPGLVRRLLGTAITLDVHARDVVASLEAAGVCSSSEFQWQSQLRTVIEDDDIVIRQVQSNKIWGAVKCMHRCT